MSIWEAWYYAWENDYWRQQGYENPWLDDNGNHLPNYVEGADKPDSGDGLFSMETYFGPGNLKTADVNDDAIVNIIDVTIVATAYGSYPGHPKWNPLADLNNDQVVNIIDVNHVASHFGKWYPTGSSKTTQNSALSEEGIINLSIITRKNNMFSVDVNIAGVTDLYGYEFKIYYGRAALNCVDINMPKKHFLEPINDPNNIYIVKMEFDNAYNATHRRIWIAVTLLGNEPGKTGKGTLVTITFAGKAKINPIISIQDIILVKAENPSIET